MCSADEVRECHSIAGPIEYLLRVEVPDLESYKRFHTEVLGTVKVVSSIVFNIVMASPKDLRSFALISLIPIASLSSVTLDVTTRVPVACPGA